MSGINRIWQILPVIQGTFAAIERAENYLPLQPFFNNTHFDKHSSTVSTINTDVVYLTSTLWRPASTHTLKMVLSQKNS